jgi:hypothetical protein
MIAAPAPCPASPAMLLIIVVLQGADWMAETAWHMCITCLLRAVRRHALMSLRNPHGVQRNGRGLARAAAVFIACTMPSAARCGERVLVTRVAERKQRKRSVAAALAAAVDRSRESGTAPAVLQPGADGMMATTLVLRHAIL